MTAYRLARALAHKVIESGYEPDIILGIARGGLVPARMVCDFLLQNDLLSITTQHWGIAKPGKGTDKILTSTGS